MRIARWLVPVSLVAGAVAVISAATLTDWFEPAAPRVQVPERPPVGVEPVYRTPEAVGWADSVLRTLPLDRQIAQLLMPPVYAKPGRENWSEAEAWVRDYGVGGFICMQGGPELQRERISRLRAETDLPLWFSSDAEWGLGMRLDSTRSWPRALTLGATRDTALIRRWGSAVAASLRATGVHINFAPVVDVNSNPANPVIGNRSFGESVEWAGMLGTAYALGLQDGGVLATAKHFPGHGDTDSDSHYTLPTVAHDPLRLDSIELAPFRDLAAAGVGAMMVAHLNIPAFESREGIPSTLSSAIVDSLLRGIIGFRGLAFTDALTMKGFADFAATETPHADALIAGNDVLVFPGKPAEAIAEVKAAITAGRLDSAAVAEKCRRVLEAKFWLRASDPVPARGTPFDFPGEETLHRDLLAAALTVVRNTDNLLPLGPSTSRVFSVQTGTGAAPEAFDAPLKKIVGAKPAVRSVASPTALPADCGKGDLVLFHLRGTNSKPGQGFGVSDETLGGVLKAARAQRSRGARVGLVVYGSPYLLARCGRPDDWDVLLVAYQDDERTQAVVAEAVAGAGRAAGRLPVSSGPYRAGEGTTLEGGERLGWLPEPWSGAGRVADLVHGAIAAGAMPGCRVVVAHKGRIVLDGAYGTLDGKAPVTEETVYDLASITKIASTTLALMKLEESGALHRSNRLATLLPEIAQSELGTRTLQDLLAHQSGLPPFLPFAADAERVPGAFSPVRDAAHPRQVAEGIYAAATWQDSVIRRIAATPISPVGTLKYSDLGYYLMQRIVEERTQTSLDATLQASVYDPLGLPTMGYRPLERFASARIAPTEDEQTFRKQLLRGHVHDPGAALIGGVAGHAGLFSDAVDLARLMTMLCNGGQYAGVQVFAPETVAAWTAPVKEFPANRKASGFDRPTAPGVEGPTCPQASPRTFGHQGFTGTCAWADPEHDLVFVFLSNRVYPDASNRKLAELNVRTEVQRIVYETLLGRAA
jgi:beta-glucosidase-like glycosyl hydrolase/CubicO group peptidase (beta-lactamase class C family)